MSAQPKRVLKLAQVNRAVSANEHTRRMAERYRVVKRQIAALQRESEEIVEKCISVLGLGRYDLVTVFRVNPTWVKRHRRRGYTAVRARLGGKI